MVIGLLAHVDAGKTTLSEAFLYQTGALRQMGRVDHGNTCLDYELQEQQRGITIFSKQARMKLGQHSVVLLDTPGHVDFSAEMERTLQVLDYAILIISATDFVQSHTMTLWRLLEHYQVPTFLFINKMDLYHDSESKIQEIIKRRLSEDCIRFGERVQEEAFCEELALCSESILNHYMETGTITEDEIADAIRKRLVFPCYYGSALRTEGIEALLEGIRLYARESENKKEQAFGARVFKIGRDEKGVRLTHVKITSGMFRTKEKIQDDDVAEKVDQIRLYSGKKYTIADVVKAGDICTFTGLRNTFPGMGLGIEKQERMPLLEPVLKYQILPPPNVSISEVLQNLRILEEEDPQLHIDWMEELQQISVRLMGEVQLEVLSRQFKERFGMDILFAEGKILYKETIARPIEGVGHFEPLRHYAEVHLWMEPQEAGTGITVAFDCPSDTLDINWQKQIATHIEERVHVGVLTGAPITDIKFTIVTGRAHLKHTEGGDFREATYRAIRQGLKATQSVLLEPYYRFELEVPTDCVGRAMTDLRQRHARFEAPEYLSCDGEERAFFSGTAPVSTICDYMTEVHSYTKGSGILCFEKAGYDFCHNDVEVIEQIGYDSEADTANPTGSVFCAHGAGYLVPWDEVPKYMHVDYIHANGREETVSEEKEEYEEKLLEKAKQFEAQCREKENKTPGTSAYELDRELQQIYAREFKLTGEDVLEQNRKKWYKKTAAVKATNGPKLDKKGNPIYPKADRRSDYLIVDGYNVVFAWEDLKELAKDNMDAARDKLVDMLHAYQGYKRCPILVVFDAYRVKGNPGSRQEQHEIQIVYTKQDETADAYIERTSHELNGKYKLIVATSDRLEQFVVSAQGARVISAGMLREEIERTMKKGYQDYLEKN